MDSSPPIVRGCLYVPTKIQLLELAGIFDPKRLDTFVYSSQLRQSLFRQAQARVESPKLLGLVLWSLHADQVQEVVSSLSSAARGPLQQEAQGVTSSQLEQVVWP